MTAWLHERGHDELLPPPHAMQTSWQESRADQRS